MQKFCVLRELGMGTKGILQGWVRMLEVVLCFLVMALKVINIFSDV